MNKLDQHYTMFINATPQKVWEAITNPEFSRQYWGGHANISDWKAGSTWQHADTNNNNEVRVTGKVLESTPPKRLILTWPNTQTAGDDSQVVFDISVVGDMVRLDVAHTKLSEDMSRGVSGGWPRVLSSMKSFLETGKALDTWVDNHASCAGKAA